MKEIKTRRSGAQWSGERRLNDPCQAHVADAASVCIIHSTTGETGEAPVLSMINTSRMNADTQNTQLLPPNIFISKVIHFLSCVRVSEGEKAR